MMLFLSKIGHNLTKINLLLTSMRLTGTLLLMSVDSNRCFNTFNSKMKGLFDWHLPVVRLTKRQRKTQLKPWITPGIIKPISKRDFLYHKFVQAKYLKPNLNSIFNLNTIEI